MLWLTLWFAVALKIPALYLAYVIWWSVKDPPAAELGNAQDGAAGPGRRGPRAPARDHRRGPHGSPDRRPRRTATLAARASRAR
jgi:hypothetical protein